MICSNESNTRTRCQKLWFYSFLNMQVNTLGQPWHSSGTDVFWAIPFRYPSWWMHPRKPSTGCLLRPFSTFISPPPGPSENLCWGLIIDRGSAIKRLLLCVTRSMRRTNIAIKRTTSIADISKESIASTDSQSIRTAFRLSEAQVLSSRKHYEVFAMNSWKTR